MISRTRINRWGLFAPAIPIVLLAFSPIVVLIILAQQEPLEIGARNLRILGNTLALTGLTVTGAIAIGVPLAFATTCLRLPRAGTALAALVSPLAIPSYLGAFTYFAATGPGGEIDSLLGIAPFEVRGLLGTSWIMCLYTFPFVLLSVRASLRRLDASLVEAGRTLGLGPLGCFFHIILPRIRRGIAAGALLVALYTLSDFATPAILGLDTFTRAIYVEYNAFGLSQAAWFSLQLMLLVFFVLILESKANTVRERAGRSLSWKPNRILKTSLWTSISVIWLSAVGLPIAMFVLWLYREGASSFELSTILYSVTPAALAAICAVLFALPIARVASQGGRTGRWMLRITSFGFGIPGIVMGTALVYVGLRLPWMYQTTAMLVLGYILRFLPLATGALREGLDRIENNLSAAARSLGASPFETFRRIKLPLIMPAALSGAALVFLEAMRELPLTLLLRPTGSETLTTRLWQVYEAGYFGEAAIPGLLLIATSFSAMILFLRSERLLGLAADKES
ncbi:iron ABC transporter permease [Puniceicoccaceae bacterium K14]|nr:iron ABC transporter permease [Puniceicoccaceae bacterium K14]